MQVGIVEPARRVDAAPLANCQLVWNRTKLKEITGKFANTW
jgi:hypothetical protein